MRQMTRVVFSSNLAASSAQALQPTLSDPIHLVLLPQEGCLHERSIFALSLVTLDFPSELTNSSELQAPWYSAVDGIDRPLSPAYLWANQRSAPLNLHECQ